MAYNPNAHGYGQYAQYQNHSQQQGQQPQYQQYQQYGQQNANYQQPGRRQSFETGDDRPGFSQSAAPQLPPRPQVANAQANQHSYGQYNYATSPPPQQYQYTQNTATSPQTQYPAYNPQQYTASQYGQQQQFAQSQYGQQQQQQQYAPTQYTQLSYASPTLSNASQPSPNLGVQSYNPAAYSPAPSQNSQQSFPAQEAQAHPSYMQWPPMSPQQSQQPSSTSSNTSPFPPHASSFQNQTTSPVQTGYTPPAPPPPPTSSILPQTYTQRPAVPGRYAYDSATPGATASPLASPVDHRLPSLPQYDANSDYNPQSSHSQQTATTAQQSYYPSNYQPTSPPPPPVPARTPTQSQPAVAAPPPPGRTQTTHQASQSSRPAPAPQRMDTTGRHPHNSGLPAPPAESQSTTVTGRPHSQSQSSVNTIQRQDSFGYSAILKEVEDAVMSSGGGASVTPKRHDTGQSTSSQRPDGLFSSGGQQRPTNGAPGINVNYSAYSDDSDAEAAAGLAAMRMAEEQEEADRQRRESVQTYRPYANPNRLPVPTKDDAAGSDSDVPVDMDTYGGRMPPAINYNYGQQQQDQQAAQGRLPYAQNDMHMPAANYMASAETPIHMINYNARTDTSGTGGLAEPNEKRHSFEDGDEVTLVDQDYSSGHTSPAKGSIRSRNSVQDTQHQPQRQSTGPGHRPLPTVPRKSLPDPSSPRNKQDPYGRPLPNVPGSPNVVKAHSVVNHNHPPTIVPPERSATDAEQRRRAHLSGVAPGAMHYDPNSLSPDSAAMAGKMGNLDLPAIPDGRRRRFIPAKLSAGDYGLCQEPWAYSSVLWWLKEMTEGDGDLKEPLIAEALVGLFTNKVPTMNIADAEALSEYVVQELFARGPLVRDEEWVKFSSVPMTGVLFQLTGTGCYSPRVHVQTARGRCYSHHCMRTLKKINLQADDIAPQRKTEDWATFYKLKKEDVEGISNKEIERQNNLHEIVTSEDYFMDQLNVLILLYREGLLRSPQPIIPEKRLRGFVQEIFGKVDAVKKANEDHLLAQLKYRQQEQGPWIKGFADIFREWIRKARVAYIEYAANLPISLLKVKQESEQNMIFRQFLDQVRDNERSRRLGWDTYMKAPTTRLQRYGLLLGTVLKHMIVDSEEKKNLIVAIEEIRQVTMECDARFAEMNKRTELIDLRTKLKLRRGMERVQLNLDSVGREIIYRGDLQRRGTNKMTWVDTHAILFDHYLVLAKPIAQRDAAGVVRHDLYDVSKLPIPMDLLILESMNDEPVMKSSVKGMTSVSVAQQRAPNSSESVRLSKVATGATGPGSNPPSLANVPTGTSIASGSSGKTLVTNTILDQQNERILYPFKVRHLGKPEIYLLYAQTQQSRQEWCDKIIEAKTRHAASLFKQNAEPFRLRVMADTAFHYDSTSGLSPRPIVIKGTPLDRAIEECDRSFYGTGPRPGALCRAQVNCATSFNHPDGRRLVAVGTDYGVYFSDYANPRGWAKSTAVPNNAVTQAAVLEDFSVFLIISDKALVAYHLDSVLPTPGTNGEHAAGGGGAGGNARTAPQKLSGNRDVGFFASGRMKERTLVFYKKRDGISSTFKVLEPVYQKSGGGARGRFGGLMGRKGATDFFRDFDDFYIPSETYAMNLFSSSLAISTSKGIEVLALDKKVPFSIPDLRAPEVARIAARLANQRPLGMFRLSDDEFLLVFEEVGIYVDKHGDVNRSVVMDFVGRARQAAVVHGGTYLVLVDQSGGFVEVRNAVNGRLRQVVSGRDVRLLDDGGQGANGGLPGTVKISMQHPERDRVQVVLEMIVNEGLKE